MGDRTHIYLNPVTEDRREDFERFLAETVAPALRRQRPDLGGRWHVLRASEPEGEPPVRVYAFIFDGGNLDEDWSLDVLLAPVLGEDEAGRVLDQWMETFAPMRQWARSWGEGDDDRGQVGWTLEPVGGLG